MTGKRRLAVVLVGVVVAYVILLAFDFSTTDPQRIAVLLFAFVVGPAVYFAPTYIAQRRKHPQKTPITVVNVFLGWTLVGWVVALAMSCSNLNRNG